MRQSRLIPVVLAAFAAVPAMELLGQSGTWETLLEKPLPEDTEPSIQLVSIPLAPAPPTPRAIGPGHTHAGPVFGYILRGEIENQVEPDPPQTYNPGDFFYETAGHVHRFMRNLSATQPAEVLAFQAGHAGQAAPVIKTLLRETLVSTANQEVSLMRLTLLPGAASEAAPSSNPGIVYVLGGKVQATGEGQIHGADDVFATPASPARLTFRNASGSEPAKLLLYQVRGR